MKKRITGIPGYRVNEYQLVLVPHEDLREKIQKVKKEFADKYQVSAGSRPHISLVRFTQMEMAEERILNRLKNIAMGFQPFRVELMDFGSFPSHTIYLQVTSKIPVRKLIREIRSVGTLLKYHAEHKPHFIDEPHIGIARKLLPWQYEKGWLEYQSRHFRGRFIANGMLLLKRPEGELSYQAVCWLEFQNLPVNTVQGDLFGKSE